MDEWIPIDANCEVLLPTDRPYEIIEAIFYLQLAHARNYNATIYGLAEKWQWSRGRVKTFLQNAGAKIVYHGSKSGTIHPIENVGNSEMVIFKLNYNGIIPLGINQPRNNGSNGSTKRSSRKGISLSLRYDILKRDGFQCSLCSASGKDARIQVDHIVPVANGGTNHKSNLRILCFECNHGKKDKTE